MVLMMPRCVGGRRACGAASGVSLGEARPRADLGGSSNYSSEILEDGCGERFRVNSAWTRVSRS